MILNLQIIFLLTAVFTLAINLPTSVFAQGEKNYCYDHVGDEQLCFDTKKKCENQLKNDRIAESPCYHTSQE